MFKIFLFLSSKEKLLTEIPASCVTPVYTKLQQFLWKVNRLLISISRFFFLLPFRSSCFTRYKQICKKKKKKYNSIDYLSFIQNPSKAQPIIYLEKRETSFFISSYRRKFLFQNIPIFLFHFTQCLINS